VISHYSSISASILLTRHRGRRGGPAKEANISDSVLDYFLASCKAVGERFVARKYIFCVLPFCGLIRS
jgi:hypothetical protein